MNCWRYGIMKNQMGNGNGARILSFSNYIRDWEYLGTTFDCKESYKNFVQCEGSVHGEFDNRGSELVWICNIVVYLDYRKGPSTCTYWGFTEALQTTHKMRGWQFFIFAIFYHPWILHRAMSCVAFGEVQWTHLCTNGFTLIKL